MKKTCVGCYAYEDAGYHGFCRLGCNVTQLYNPLANNPNNEEKYHFGRYAGGNGDYFHYKCKPAENCIKPKTIAELVTALKK